MAHIDERKKHTIGKDAARQEAQKLATDIGEKIGASYHWEGDDLKFERSGANGCIHVSDDEIRVEVNLSFVLRPLKGTIQSKIRSYMDENVA